MSIIIPANTLAAGGSFDVDNSCRFETNTSLTKDIDSTNTSWTFSLWVKRTKLSATQYMISYGDSGVTNAIGFSAANLFQYYGEEEGYLIATAAALTDTSAWYHLVCKNASGTITMYVNGVAIPTTGGTTGSALSAGIFRVGAYQGGGLFFGGYMAEVCFIDSAALNPTSFGEFDEDSGIWKAIDVSGLTFGTDGFHLDFKASGNLGNDANGGTDLTEVNLAAVDQSTDTCTNNFATINSLDNFYAQATFSEGNLRVVTQVAAFAPIRSTIGVSSGKWYAEVKIITASATDHEQGVVSQAAVNNSAGVGRIAEGYGYAGNGQVFRNDSQVTYSANSLAADDILGIYLDLDNNKLYFAKNGTIQNSGAGISMVDPASTTDGVYYFATSDNANLSGGSYRFDWNFGNPIFTGTDKSDANGYGSFEYDPSAGTFDSASKDFYALCTKNLAEFG